MTSASIRVLLIDDDEDYCFIVRDLLADVDGTRYDVVWMPNIAAARQALQTKVFDVCLVDYRLGEANDNGLDFLREIIQQGLDLPFILMTGQDDRAIDLEAMSLRAADYIHKSELNAALLERTLRYAIEHTRYLQQLRSYAADLEAKNRELDAYTHTIAHDLTNPLSQVAGLAGLVLLKQGDVLSPESVDMLKGIEDQILKMAEMVRQLLWLAQVRDAAEVIVPIEIEPVVKGALSRFENLIRERAIAVDIEGDMPIVMGQDMWLEEVFANLIGNAIKYIGQDNSAAKLTIRGYRRKNFAMFEVEDNGIGIAPKDQTHLFEMFSRVQNKQTPNIAGVGLGLSIVHRIVTKLGGEVGVKSQIGSGSTFWFTLALPKKST